MRKIFGTDGVRGVANAYPMTAEVALKLGKAAAKVLSNGNHKVVIGKDTRLSGYIFESALTAGFCSMGIDVYLVGPMPTPAIGHLTKSFGADAGVVISASHNPADDNGIKFFGRDGFKLADSEEEKIESLALGAEISTEHVAPAKIGRAFRINDARGRYIESVKNSVSNISLKGLKLVLDCANGAAYSVAPFIFSELGAEVVVLNNNPDGMNINKECGATYPKVIRDAVLREHADIGVALDGDADRAIFVDESGNEVDGDQVLAICALQFAQKGLLKGNAIVATEYSNLGLTEAMAARGIEVIRVENGDRYVLDEMRKRGCNLGGERTGHTIFLDYSTTGDGTLTALQVITVMKQQGKRLSELASQMHKHPQLMININVKEKKDISAMTKVQELIKLAEARLGKEGRIFIRYSGTQNILRIMAEGKDEQLIRQAAETVAAELRKEIGA